MKKGSFWKNYGFLILMLTGIVAGCVVAVGVFIWLFDFVAQVGIDALIGLFH